MASVVRNIAAKCYCSCAPCRRLVAADSEERMPLIHRQDSDSDFTSPRRRNSVDSDDSDHVMCESCIICCAESSVPDSKHSKKFYLLCHIFFGVAAVMIALAYNTIEGLLNQSSYTYLVVFIFIVVCFYMFCVSICCMGSKCNTSMTYSIVIVEVIFAIITVGKILAMPLYYWKAKCDDLFTAMEYAETGLIIGIPACLVFMLMVCKDIASGCLRCFNAVFLLGCTIIKVVMLAYLVFSYRGLLDDGSTILLDSFEIVYPLQFNLTGENGTETVTVTSVTIEYMNEIDVKDLYCTGGSKSFSTPCGDFFKWEINNETFRLYPPFLDKLSTMTDCRIRLRINSTTGMDGITPYIQYNTQLQTFFEGTSGRYMSDFINSNTIVNLWDNQACQDNSGAAFKEAYTCPDLPLNSDNVSVPDIGIIGPLKVTELNAKYDPTMTLD